MQLLISDMTIMTITIISLMVFFTAFYIFLNRHTFFSNREAEEKTEKTKQNKRPNVFKKIWYFFRGQPPINYDEPLPSAPGKSYNYSYAARLTLAPKESLERYNKLKNYILSYANVVSSLTWKEETFLYRGKIVLKLRIHGQTMRLYLALAIDDLNQEQYKVTDVSQYKEHEQTNIYYRIRTMKMVEEAVELVDLCFLKLGIQKGMLPVAQEDFSLPRKTRATLLNENLIKEVDAPIIIGGQDNEEEDENVS